MLTAVKTGISPGTMNRVILAAGHVSLPPRSRVQ